MSVPLHHYGLTFAIGPIIIVLKPGYIDRIRASAPWGHVSHALQSEVYPKIFILNETLNDPPPPFDRDSLLCSSVWGGGTHKSKGLLASVLVTS